MAKRTKLVAPSAEELAAIEADIRSETRARPNPATAPIAQVAAEAAQISTGEPAQQRLDRLDAERLRQAEESGLLIAELPLGKIDTDGMIRDRTALNADELTELKLSIRESGLRLPIEVYQAADGGYQLLSGYRRLLAFRDLNDLNPGGDFAAIKAIVRPQTDTASAFVAMVEENEIRANLSHFERGRIAVIAAQQGAFANTEAAIGSLFKMASAAKRSKVKSFAEVFEVLGDLLDFPESLTERRGLRLAGALRQGATKALRDALSSSAVVTPEDEWALMEVIVEAVEAGPVKVAKRGRPKVPQPLGWEGNDTLHLASGISLRKEIDAQGDFLIRITGENADQEILDAAMTHLQALFDKEI